MFEGKMVLSDAHSFGGPTLGQRLQKLNTKKPWLQSLGSVTAVPIKLWVLILPMTVFHNGPADSSTAPGGHPPSLICKMDIQLEHTVGREVCKAVSWYVVDKCQSSLS